MAERQQALAAEILKDPEVDSLSSIIGVDGTNTTLNTGRLLINLKPLEQRAARATEIIRRLQKNTAHISGITLHMQPAQDLTITANVSRTQYNLVLEDPNPDELALWTPRLTNRLAQLPQLEGVANDAAQNGLAVSVTIDRSTAARFGISPATVDNALYDSFGQRIVSTIYTQSNQYRVILEADPAFQTSLQSLQSIYLPSSIKSQGQVPLSAIATISERPVALQVSHFGQFPAATISFDVTPGTSLGEAITAIENAWQEIGLPPSVDDPLPRGGTGLPGFARQRGPADRRGDRDDVHRPGRALRELHPSGDHPLDAAVGGHRRAAGADGRRPRPRRDRHHRHRPADRHRQEERHHDGRFRARGRARARRRRRARLSAKPACCASGRS